MPGQKGGGHRLQRTGRTGPGGTGSPAQGVFGVSCQANGGAIFFREPGAPARGGRGVLPRGCSESPARPMGDHLLQRTGRTGPGGTGSPAQGVFGVSCQAKGGPSSSENRAHRPGGDGEPYTVPKGCWIPIPGCPTGRGQGLCLRAYNRLTHIQRLLVWQPAPLQSCTTQACFSSLLIPSHMLQGGGSLLGPPAHAYATGHPLLPGTAPLLGRGPLTCTLQGPFHLHTWTLAMKTPHWSLLVGAPGSSCSRGRPPMRGPGGAPHGRCWPVRGARAGEGGGGGGGGQWAGEAARSGCGR